MRGPLGSLTLMMLVGCLTKSISVENDNDGNDSGGDPSAPSGGKASSSNGSGATVSGATTGAVGVPGDAPAGQAGAASLPADALEPAEPVSELQLGDVSVSEAACVRQGEDVQCTLRLTAETKDTEVLLPTWSGIGCTNSTAYAYDDRGNRYVPSHVSSGGQTVTASSGACLSLQLIAGVAVEVAYDFPSISPNASEIALLNFAPIVDGVVHDVELRRLSLSDEPAAPAPDGVELLGAPVGRVTALGVAVDYFACTRAAGSMDCPLVLTAALTDRELVIVRQNGIGTGCGGTSSAFDDQGAEYVPARLDLAGESGTGCALGRRLVRGVPTYANLHFDEVDAAATTIAQLRVGLRVDGKFQELKLAGLPLEG